MNVRVDPNFKGFYGSDQQGSCNGSLRMIMNRRMFDYLL